MTRAEAVSRYSFTITQVGIVGLLIALGGWLVGSVLTNSFSVSKTGLGSDTPIIISGGSIRFVATKSDWQACTTGSTTCYMAESKKDDKKKLKEYHFLDEDYNDHPEPVAAAAKGTGWEIDVVDANNQVVRVCAQLASPTTCDTQNQITSNYIYVINTGSGSFDSPTGVGGKKNRLIYKNSGGQAKDAHIATIKLNVSDPKEMDQPCNDSECRLILERK